MKKLLLLLFCLSVSFGFVSCVSDAYVASNNLSKAADQFEIFRRVVFYNGITGDYILSIEGYCSISHQSNKVTVTVKTDNGDYLKHYLGLSDNVTYFAEQIEGKKVSKGRYRVIFKPSTIIPNIDIR